MGSDSERLAVIENEMRNQTAMLKSFIAAQNRHNDNFYATRDKMIAMEANAKGAWWMLGILGTMVSAVVALVVSWFKSS